MSQTIGHGSTLNLGNPGPPWLAIPGVISIDFGSDKVDAVDSTAMDTAGSTRAYIGGLENPGDVTIKINVIPANANQNSLLAAKDGGVHLFQAIYPGTVRTIAFSGIITSIDESIPGDKLPTYSVKIQVTGPKTFS